MAEAFDVLFGGGVFLVVLWGILILWFVVLMYMALWGLYATGKAHRELVASAERTRALVAYQTDYLERIATAQEVRASGVEAQAAGTVRIAEQLSRPHEVVVLQAAD